MPYQLLIHWDDGQSPEVAAEGTYMEVVKHMPIIASTIDPDKAIWELVWRPGKFSIELASTLTHALMGHQNGKA